MKGSMALYNAVLMLGLGLGMPLWGPMLAWRPRLRVGFFPRLAGKAPLRGRDEPSGVWFHAVSVGEVMASLPLLQVLAHSCRDGGLWVSTVTSTGQAVARAKAQGVRSTFYLPYDLPWSVARAVKRLRPRLFVTAETELWPNLLVGLRERGVALALVNGRISDRSFPRYRRFKALFRTVLDCFDVLCMQSEESAERMVAMGAHPAKVHVVGNLKFDVATPPVDEARWRSLLGIPQGVPVWVAGSTHPGEEECILKAFLRASRSCPQLHLVVAPRAPERFDEVETLVACLGVPVRRRSRGGKGEARVVLLDTMGELAHVYGLATVGFVGGSLVDRGGHNPLEVALHGRPVLFGPHMENFREIASLLLKAGGARCIKGQEELGDSVEQILASPDLREQMGQRAHGVLLAHRGATQRTMELLRPLLERDPWA